MLIYGVDPSYRGLVVSRLGLQQGGSPLAWDVHSTANIGKKFWETFPHVIKQSRSYCKSFPVGTIHDDYLLFYEIPSLVAPFASAMWSLTSVLLQYNYEDPRCKYIGLFNSSYLRSLLSGRGVKYSKAKMRVIGDRLRMLVANTVFAQAGKVDADVAASLIFLFSGLLHYWRSEGKLGRISLRAGDSLEPKIPGVLEAGEHALASEGMNRSGVPNDASRAGDNTTLLHKHHRITRTNNEIAFIRKESNKLEAIQRDEDGGLKEFRDEVIPPPDSFSLVSSLVRVIMQSELGSLKWGDSIRLK